MFSKFLSRVPENFIRISKKSLHSTPLSIPKVPTKELCKPTNISHMCIRDGHLIPPNQYDYDLPVFLTNPFKACVKNWELIPILVVVMYAMGMLMAAVIWAIFNKMDVVYRPHSLDYISRTMDLRHPTIHKLVVINQRYDPWPELADVMDAMRAADLDAREKARRCGMEKKKNEK